jgi:hypothetical protein
MPGFQRPVPWRSEHPGQQAANNVFVFRDQDDARVTVGLGLLQNGLETRGTTDLLKLHA